jgi:hypothetical protein
MQDPRIAPPGGGQIAPQGISPGTRGQGRSARAGGAGGGSRKSRGRREGGPCHCASPGSSTRSRSGCSVRCSKRSRRPPRRIRYRSTPWLRLAARRPIAIRSWSRPRRRSARRSRGCARTCWSGARTGPAWRAGSRASSGAGTSIRRPGRCSRCCCCAAHRPPASCASAAHACTPSRAWPLAARPISPHPPPAIRACHPRGRVSAEMRLGRSTGRSLRAR